MVTLSLIKEASIYSGEKTASSISGAGKTGIGSFKTNCRCAFLSNSRALQKAVLLLDKARITDLIFRRKLRIFKFFNSFLRKLRIDLQLSFGQIFVRITGKTDDQKLTIWQMAMTPYYDYRRNSVSS